MELITPNSNENPKRYRVNEIFASLQGEGAMAGSANVFIRFAGCNLRCDLAEGERSPGGFACDTEFVSFRELTAAEMISEVETLYPKIRRCILTGGEPALQVDKELVQALQQNHYTVAIETNGTMDVSALELDWITVSPKVAEHAVKQKWADEVRYVRGYGQGIPRTVVQATHYFISPAFDGSHLDNRTLEWCINLVKENPIWKLSLQLHKFMQIR
jgi:organic radical activating enzyme